MTKRQARKIARMYTGTIALQDDSFYVPGLTFDENQLVINQIKTIGTGLLGADGEQVSFTQFEIASYVLGRPVAGYIGRAGQETVTACSRL